VCCGTGEMKDVLVIVAHPDDEIIWGGGTVLQNLGWDWTVLCLCRGDDTDRSRKFKSVCAALGLAGSMSDLDDSAPLKPIDPRRDIGDRIMSITEDRGWDLCLTHGENGEYGHQRHKEVHGQVRRLFEDGILKCDELWTFAYRCSARSGVCRAAKGADIVVELADKQLAEKRRIMRDEYGYAGDSFEVKACVSPEAFRRQRTA
jgi:hypothetical protein